MYLHLGQDTMIRTRDVIGIFDIENSSISKSTRNYLKEAEKNGRVINVSFELPKSFVVCKEKENVRVYISQISASTLKKRTGFIEQIGLK